MRRIAALLASASIVIALAARPVAATPAAPETGSASNVVRVPPDAVGLTLSQIVGTGLAVTLDSGASEEHDLVVSNHTSDLRLTIKLTATDATGVLGADAASWLAFGDDEIELDPHAATIVPMTIAVPHDTQPGSALAHVNAAVETAVAAADGSPVNGTASQSFPVSIVVQGTPTAQIAIADVHRVDQGSQHQLAIVIRNFGDDGANVTGHVTVAGDSPQTLPFHADLAGSRDTTVDLDWNAPPAGTPSDIAVELDYGGGRTALWSSRLGGAPTKLSTGPPDTDATPATTPAATDTASSSPGPAKPWWKQPIVTVLAILALLGAALWFVMEMRSSSRRRRTWVASPVAYGPAWAGPPSEESVDLAKQLVRLTEVVVQLVAAHSVEELVDGDGSRARSPDVAVAPVPVPAPATSARPIETGDTTGARAGPEPKDPPGSDPPAGLDEEPPAAPEPMSPSELESSAPTAPSVVARPEPPAEVIRSEPSGAGDEGEAVVAFVPLPEPPAPFGAAEEDPLVAVARDELGQEPQEIALLAAARDEIAYAATADPDEETLRRLMALDRERRQLHDWMDAEDAAGELLDPPPARTGR